MKMGIRKPSIKKSIKARTTGKLKRAAKKAVNPLYGKKGMGFVNNPKKAVYNKVYNKTTVGVSDLLTSGKSSSGKTTSQKTTSARTAPVQRTNHSTSVKATAVYSSKTYKVCGVVLKIVSSLIILLALILLFASPVAGLLFAAFGVGLFVLGNGYTKRGKILSISEANVANEAADSQSLVDDCESNGDISAVEGLDSK